MGQLFFQESHKTMQTTGILSVARHLRTRVRRAEIDLLATSKEFGDFVALTTDVLKALPADHHRWNFSFGDWSVDDELAILEACCVLAEIYDVKSDAGSAMDIISRVGSDSLSALELLGAAEVAVADNLNLIGARISAVVSLATAQSRRGYHLMASSLLEFCSDKLDSVSWASTGEGCHDLRADIAYARGSVHLHVGELSDARLQFQKAVEQTMLHHSPQDGKEATKGAVRHGILHGDGTQYMLAKCFAFGLARVSMHTGEVLRALTNASVGTALFAGAHDSIHLGYATMVYGMALRARFQVSVPETEVYLDRSERCYRTALSIFEESGSRHKKRAIDEIAGVFLRRFALADSQKKPDEARYFLEEAERWARLSTTQTTSNRKGWNCILLSRIYRNKGDYPAAMRYANEVIQDSGGNQKELRVAALIALGEVCVARANKEMNVETRSTQGTEAEKTFLEALKLSDEESLNVVSCRLHLIRAAVARNDFQAGQHYMREWERHRNEASLENGALIDLEKVAKSEFKARLQNDFVLSAEQYDQFSWNEILELLRSWLIERWQGDLGGVDRMVEQLKISRATAYNWKKGNPGEKSTDESQGKLDRR